MQWRERNERPEMILAQRHTHPMCIHPHPRTTIHRTKPHISMLDRTNLLYPRLDGDPFSVLQFPRWNILYKEMRA